MAAPWPEAERQTLAEEHCLCHLLRPNKKSKKCIEQEIYMSGTIFLIVNMYFEQN